jgi:BirA family biotin operon repressor/biotin-[acetyl-CoA-carboxylase] ligase
MHETRARVLDALADGPISGPALADRLDVSRAAVWKHVDALRDAGFEIRSEGEGYHLAGVPEFGAAAVEFELDAPYAVEYHETIGSTNERARELAAEGGEDVVVLADAQMGGRGRLDREWASPPGGIWLSVLVRPTVPPADVPLYTLAAAVATAETAREFGVDAGIKWPNDVLVDGQKLAGILTEMEGEADRVSWVIVGVGVNANVDPADLPAGTDATSLQTILEEPIDRRAFTQQFLDRFQTLRSDPEAILPAWRDLSVTLGETVRVETPGETVEGRAVDVQSPGSLVVETSEGRTIVTAGDCEHLRPTVS